MNPVIDPGVIPRSEKRFRAVVMGCSAGGMRALGTILGLLPETFSVPIIAVQHIAANADSFLVTFLDEHCRLSVSEAEEKEKARPGWVYIAPPGYHLLLERDGTFSLTIDPKYNYSRPSIDILFETAADAFRERLIGVLLTGASSDGAFGLRRIKDFGGVTIVQDPKTAEASLMPRSAIEVGAAGRVLRREGRHVHEHRAARAARPPRARAAGRDAAGLGDSVRRRDPPRLPDDVREPGRYHG